MNSIVWRSLLMRIVLLSIVSCLFLSIAAGSFYYFLRSSYTTTIHNAEQNLIRISEIAAQTYARQLSSGASLSHVPATSPHASASVSEGTLLPPPPPAAGGLPLPPFDQFAQVTSHALYKEQGIEGGFLARTGQLVGYAFPTHEGPGPQRAIPQRERPIIDRLARDAAYSGSLKTFVFEGPHDVVLFVARPLRESIDGKDQVSGAIWLMQRLPDLSQGRSRQLLFAAIAFGSAALISALLAWFITVEIRGGVNSITHHLATLDKDLTHRPKREERPRLLEFAQVVDGIDAMALSLQTRIARERSLELELRHKERLSSLGQFAAGIAHELRNPLATIRLRAQMASDGSEDAAVARSSNVILEEVDRLDTMIGKLLHFSRPIFFDPKLIELCEFCSTMVASWENRARPGITLHQQCPANALILSDPSRLVQVLDNLLENAMQAIKTELGEVTISVHQQGSNFIIEVADSGIGFSSEALKHAFDPFFTEKDTGTGLGLSIAFELIQALGGTLRAENRLEGGAVVTVTLPATNALEAL